MKTNSLLLGILATVLVGCANHGDISASGNIVTDGVVSGVPAIDGGANMGNSQSGAISKLFLPSRSEILAVTASQQLKSLSMSDAQATVGCGEFAVQDACSNSVEQANYVNCQNWGGTINGQMILDYSNATCSFNTAGQTITRSVNVTRSGLFGGTVTTDSQSPTIAWNGTAIGTGETLTYIAANSYTYSIGGVHKARTDTLGNTLYDVSVTTSAAMNLTGSLSAGRTLDGGSVSVFHNLAKYKAVFVPHQLAYTSATCCHPTGGTITATYTGSVTGTGTIAFPGTCGLATILFAGASQTVQLQGCE